MTRKPVEAVSTAGWSVMVVRHGGACLHPFWGGHVGDPLAPGDVTQSVVLGSATSASLGACWILQKSHAESQIS